MDNGVGVSSREVDIDLVLSTFERTHELVRLLESLASQTSRRFRLVIADQNPDGGLDPLLEGYADAFEILHLRPGGRGVSRGRNTGLAYSRAGLVTFPDDDCWYPPDFFERLVRVFAANPDRDGMTCLTLDEASARSGIIWAKEAGPVTRGNVFRRSIGPATFYRRRVIDAVGLFDETLGVGAGTPWGSGDDTDYLLRALDHGCTVVFEPALAIRHPGPNPDVRDRAKMAAAYSYGMGHSELLRRHGYPLSFRVRRVCELSAGAACFLAIGRPGRARFYSAMARGRARALVLPHGRVGRVRSWRPASSPESRGLDAGLEHR